MAKLNWSTSNSQITDEIIYVSSSVAVGLQHDMFYSKAAKPIVISTGAGGTGTVLAETTDYTVGGVISTVPNNIASIAPDVIYSTVAITNAAYHDTVLYCSYYPLGDLAEGSDLFGAGMIMPFGGTTAPGGWLDCDGSAVNRGSYAGLYKAIGTTWGVGDGSTTFNVPDLRGVFLRGAGANGTLTDANSDPFDGGSVGDTANDKMQRITGYIDVRRAGDTATSTLFEGDSGALDRDASGGESSTISMDRSNISAYDTDRLNFDSDDSPNARTGDETQPVNASVLYIIKT